MDSQDKTLEQGTVEEQLNAPTVENNGEETAANKSYATKAEVLTRLKELAHGDETPSKAEVDHLKTVFYKLHIQQREAQQKEFLEKGGNPEEYQVVPDAEEETFKAEMSLVKEKRQKASLIIRCLLMSLNNMLILS